MRKADSLRAHLAQWHPALARDPERLRMWIETGKVRSINGADGAGARHFAWDYTLTVLVTEFTGNPSEFAATINEWCAGQAPELLQQESGYAFEADILDAATFDVQFALPLSEPVLVTPRAGGGWTIEHPAEPAPLFPDDEPGGGLLQEIWHDRAEEFGGDERIVPPEEGPAPPPIPPLPANALLLGGEPLTLGGTLLTLG